MKYAIIASKGQFPDVYTAANAEEKINWWDDDEYENQRICTVAWAATELEKYLPGQTCILTDEIESVNTDTVILLGRSDENAFVKKLEDKIKTNLGCGENVAKNGYRMLGFCHEGKNYVVLSGSDRVGTLYSAYSYLERMGVNFIEPGDPQYSAANSECTFDITEEPSFNSRGAMSSFIDGDIKFLEWMAHNKFNTVTLKREGHPYHTQKKLGIDSVEGGHKIFYTFMQPHEEYPYRHALYGGERKPPDPYPVSELCKAPSAQNGILTYGDAHPEWYALVDGVRRMKRFPEDFKRRGGAPGDNICTSNQNGTEELCKQLVDALSDGMWKYADYLNFWPIDNGTWCECNECKRLGNFSRRMLLLVYKLDKRLKEARNAGKIKREIKIICPAYHETLDIPSDTLPQDFDYQTCSVVFYPIERCYLHNIDDPNCKETNATLFSNLLPWTEEKSYKGDLVIGEYYNVSTFAAMPFVLFSRMKHEIPLYYALGARQFHYMHMTARDWGFIAINNYIHGKLIWNVNADAEALKNQYFRARYANLSKEMQALYEKIEKATSNCKFYKHYQYLDGKRASLFMRLSACEKLTAENLFPTHHMKLDYRADDAQAGPSLKETLIELCEAREKLSEIALHPQSEAVTLQLQRDMRRLDYGVRMTEFLYLACLVSIGKTEYKEDLRVLAENLESDTESMQGYDFGENFTNALNASWIAKTYHEKFSGKKGGEHSDGIAL